MSFIEFSKKLLMNFFIIVTGITVAIAVLGMSFYPKASLPYNAFYSPLIFGIAATLPSFVLYSKKELSFKQMLFRRVLQFILIVIAQFGIAYLGGLLKSIQITIMLFLSVLVVYLFTSAIGWIIDSKTAVDINEGLKRLK